MLISARVRELVVGFFVLCLQGINLQGINVGRWKIIVQLKKNKRQINFYIGKIILLILVKIFLFNFLI